MENLKNSELKSTLNIAVFRILRALAKVTIPLGMSAAMMSELVRCAYVEAAEELLEEKNEKVQLTKIAVMTGLYRKEIVRLRNLPPLSDVHSLEKYNRTTRVVTGWLRDKDFHTSRGHAAALSQTGENSFAELVNRYSGGMAPVAMLRELERLGVVSVNSRGQVKLLTSGYIANMPLESIEILGIDTADLIHTIHHNTLADTANPRYQRKVTYNDLPPRYVAPFRRYAARESQKLLVKLDRWLARYDGESTDATDQGKRVGLGVYYIERSSADDFMSRDRDDN
jgi:hypothetical protein